MAEDRAVRRVARRVYWREADARVVVEDWRRSGRSLRWYCDDLGLSPKRLGRWAARIAEQPEALRFHPVEVVGGSPQQSDDRIEVELRGGELVRLPAGFAMDDLRHVLQVLGERTEC